MADMGTLCTACQIITLPQTLSCAGGWEVGQGQCHCSKRSLCSLCGHPPVAGCDCDYGKLVKEIYRLCQPVFTDNPYKRDNWF